MHRSAAPDKQQRRATAIKEGANVVHQEQDTRTQRPDGEGEGHDERGHYGAAPVSGSLDQVKSRPS